MFSNDPYVHEMYKLLLGDNVHWQDREAWIYSKDVYTRYPFQGSLYGLPPDVIKECVVGAIEARFGALKAGAKPVPKPSSNGKPHANGNVASCAVKGDAKGDGVNDCCADGVAESTVPLVSRNGANGRHAAPQAAGPRNFEEFIYQVWGAG